MTGLARDRSIEEGRFVRRTAVGVLREAHMSRAIAVHHGVRVEEEGVLHHQRRRVCHVQVVPVEVAPCRAAISLGTVLGTLLGTLAGSDAACSDATSSVQDRMRSQTQATFSSWRQDRCKQHDHDHCHVMMTVMASGMDHDHA